MGISDADLYRLLYDNQFLTKEQLTSVSEVAKREKISLYNAIIDKDLLADENIGKLVADYLKLPFVNLAKTSIDEQILKMIPESVAKERMIIVFGVGKKGVKVASFDPDKELLNLISKKIGYELDLYYATERDIQEALALYKKQLEIAFSELLADFFDKEGKVINKDIPVANLLNTLIEYGYVNKASDIHIEPGEEFSLVRFRIDGVLHDELKLPISLHNQIIARIKVASSLRTDEHLSAQDGKMQVKLQEEDVDIRISIVPIVGGEKCVMRLLTSHFRQFGLTDLGMGEADLNKTKSGFSKPYGMILATGPTGSGKTTTMYAILKILNTRERNIATIEDPVEYDIEGINQIQVNPKTNLTFAEGLRSILRQDPDIIYVGEIRDEETADIAINSATTGHLVLSTLHTNDAATALPRLIDQGIEPFLVASTVNVIVAQRLVRKICDKCKVSYTDSADKLGRNINSELVKKHFGEGGELRLYHGKGCPVCHGTGYRGRVGIFEVLEVSEKIQELISQKSDSESITRQAVADGMQTMLDDGLDKVQQGVTTLEEVLTATKG